MKSFIQFFTRIGSSKTVMGAFVLLLIGTVVRLATADVEQTAKHHPNPPLHDSNSIRFFMSSAVSVVVEIEPKVYGAVGAGVVVRALPSKTLLVLTAMHVSQNFQKKGTIRLRINEQLSLREVKVIAEDEEDDLALLATTTPWDGPDIAAMLATAPPQRGDTVWLVGAPNGHEFNVSRGVVSNLRECNSGPDFCYRLDAPMYYGSSGGGAYNIAGELIGIADYLETEDFKIQHPRRITVPGSAGVIGWYAISAFLKENMP